MDMSTQKDCCPAGHERRLATLESLLAITAPTVQGALTEATQLVVAVLAADKADAFLYDPASDSLVAVGTSDTPMGRQQHRLGLHRLPLSNGGQTVEVFQTGASYHTGHAEADPEVERGVREALGVRSILTAAIPTDGPCRGVFQVVSAEPERFSVEDLRFIESVARWVGLVAQRETLVERITHDTAERTRRVAADEIINVLAHDLRTPLTPLRGHLDMILRRAEREGRDDYRHNAREAEVAVHRLNRLITTLLDAGRLEQGLFSLSGQPVNLADLARQSAALLRGPDQDMRVQAPDEVCVTGDPDALQQVLENLLSNALQHSPPGVPVVVQVETVPQPDQTWAVLSVRDEGPGIPTDLLPTLFDRFARGASSSGLGLGLYVARGIVEAHAGTLAVESDRGKGTCFRVSLPLMSACS